VLGQWILSAAALVFLAAIVAGIFCDDRDPAEDAAAPRARSR